MRQFYRDASPATGRTSFPVAATVQVSLGQSLILTENGIGWFGPKEL